MAKSLDYWYANTLCAVVRAVARRPIGVIYEGYRYPHFLDWGTVAPIFQDTDEEFAVIRGDLCMEIKLHYAPDFFPASANMCHNLFLSTFLVLSPGTITLTHFAISIIIRTGNQNED